MQESKSNGLEDIISQAIEEMKSEQGNNFSLEKINLAELGRRTGVSRAKLRRLKENNFSFKPHALEGRKVPKTVLSGYTAILDTLLKKGITNSSVCLERLRAVGYPGGLTTVKDYIAAHKHLVPAKRQLVAPQGNRGRRFTTEPGEAYQMDWGFTKVLDYDGTEYTAACFAMVCHHCGQRYVEFFPNAKQENLFIGMIHAFGYMGIPKYVLTDNMKSVVLHRDFEGHPVWQKDYECCQRGIKTYFIKMSELRDKFTAARRAGKEASVLDGLVRPSCLIIDEVGHCEFDKENTRLFFDLIDRRYNKEGNFNIVFTSNKHPSHWRTNFNEDDALLCALDRIFDDATVFNIKGESFRGKRLETIALQTSRVKAPDSSETPTP